MILQLVGSILLLVGCGSILLLASCGSINHSLGQSWGSISLLMCVHSSCVDFTCEKLTKYEQGQGLKKSV
jgi:hypothetical protein